MAKIQSKARVQIMLEVDLGDVWGDECTIAQVHAQAGREATNAVRRLLHEEMIKGKMRLLGEPNVFAVIAEDAK